MKTNKTFSKLVLVVTIFSFAISSCNTSSHFSSSFNTRGLNWVKASPKKTVGEKKAVVLNDNKKENAGTEISPLAVKQAGVTAISSVPSVKPLSVATAKKAASSKGDVSISKKSSSVTSSNELTVAKKEIKAQAKENKKLATSKRRGGSGKSQLIALILCAFLVYIGIHRFYLGYIGMGILELLTGGLCGILTLIDFIRIITGGLQPKNGSYSSSL